MELTLTPDEMNACCTELHESNAAFKPHYPADSSERQPVHTAHGSANLFKAGFAGKLLLAGNGPRRDHRAGGSGHRNHPGRTAFAFVRSHCRQSNRQTTADRP